MSPRAGALAATLLCAGCALRGPALPPDTASATVGADPERQIVVVLRGAPAAALPAAGSTARGPFGPAAYRASPDTLHTLAALAEDHGLRLLEHWPIAVLRVHCAVLEVAPGRARADVIDALAADARVESVQPLQRFAALSGGDPQRPQQHARARLQIGPAHQRAQGRGVRVAIVDSGVDRRHAELRARIVASADFVGPGAGAFDDDVHGTAVAGVLAASADNGEGFVGVAPMAELLALRACWSASAAAAVCDSFTLARALAAAIDGGARLINLSLAGPHDPLLERLLRAARDRGIHVIAAVPDDPAHGFPSALDGVIAVAALEQPAPGALHAPGRELLTTRPGNAYAFDSGSSLAAAQVSGVVALLLEHDRALDGDALHALLRASAASPLVPAATPPSPAAVNACRALALLLRDGDCKESGAPRVATRAP
ncbi:MAG: S8 family peptidase [Gammaproteobacteria bacterium]